jgi:hypothetical protein
VDGFIRAATDIGPLDHYKYFGERTKNIIEQIKTAHGTPAVRAFLRAALGRTISLSEDQGLYQQLPPLCAYYHALQLQRIAGDTDTSTAWLDLSADTFHKEFGIASTRLYVGGPNLIDYRCGVSRSIMFGEGLPKAFAKVAFMLRLGGFKPYFQGHLHLFTLDAFNEAGRNDFYRCCVELYTRHPESLGTICCSWYYDPAIDEISPWLTYLRAVPLSAGAQLFFVENGGEATTNATAKSKTRLRLYEQGEYSPKNYMFVWGRNNQVKWARTHPHNTASSG